MLNECKATEDLIKAIIESAKKDPIKGRYYVYEQYKSKLWDVCESNYQFERACIDLAKALKI